MCFQRQDVIEEPPQKKPRTPQSEVVDADKLLAANAVQSQWCYTSLPPLQKKVAAGFAIHSFCYSPQLVAVARTHLCHAACDHEEIGNSNAMELKYLVCQVEKLRRSCPGCCSCSGSCSLIKWEVLVLSETVFGLRKTFTWESSHFVRQYN